MNPAGVVFDLDGTLLDTLTDIAVTTNEVLARRGRPTHEVVKYKHFIGDGVRTLFERTLPPEDRGAETIEACVRDFEEIYARRWNETSELYDGIAELLDDLAGRGLRLAVLSNKPHAFTLKYAAHFLAGRPFDVVLGQRADVPKKPDPAGANEIAARWRLPAERIVYLGDTAVDMKTAQAAGMRPWGVLWGFRDAAELRTAGAEKLFAHPRDVIAEIAGLMDRNP